MTRFLRRIAALISLTWLVGRVLFSLPFFCIGFVFGSVWHGLRNGFEASKTL